MYTSYFLKICMALAPGRAPRSHGRAVDKNISLNRTAATR
jgi:hypothetical protein